jgi:hypothetical protein
MVEKTVCISGAFNDLISDIIPAINPKIITKWYALYFFIF